MFLYRLFFSKTFTLVSNDSSLSAIVETVGLITSSMVTRNWCFSDIFLSHVAKSFLSEAALAARFRASDIGKFVLLS